jgi:hypothetical protein
MAYLVSTGKDERVPIGYRLYAIVVEMALVVPLRLVNQIVGLVLVEKRLDVGN